MHREANASRNADRDGERRWPEIARPVPATVGPKPCVAALVIVLEDGADRDAFPGTTELERNVGYAAAAKDLLGAELDLRSRAFGDSHVTDGSVKTEPFPAGHRLGSGKDFGVAAEYLRGGEGWDQGDQGQSDAEDAHWGLRLSYARFDSRLGPPVCMRGVAKLGADSNFLWRLCDLCTGNWSLTPISGLSID